MYLFTWNVVYDMLLSGEKRLPKQSGLIFILYLFLYGKVLSKKSTRVYNWMVEL